VSRNLRDGLYVALVLCTLSFLVSCGNVGAAPISGLGGINAVSVQITPPTITVGTNSVTPFTATVNGAGLQAVQWQVNSIPGGAAEIGTIDTSGNYTAPQFVPIPANVVITAIADADNTRSGTASVNITGTLYPATVYLSPTGTAYVQKGTQLQLSAGITGPADTSVVWQVNGVQNGNSRVGTIVPGADGSAVYNAPAVVPNPSTVSIQAVSHAEPDRSNSVAVALSNTPPTIATVTISPVFAVVEGGTSSTFNATVIGASDTSVSWYVHNEPGGDITYGTIAGVNATQGSYTAPFTIPKTGSTVYPVVASNAQPSRATTAAVTISPPPPLSVSVSVGGPQNITVGSTQAYTASLLNATNQGIIWQVDGITGGNSKLGTIAPSTSVPNEGDYTAPNNVPVPATVVIGAVPVQNPKVAGTLPVTVAVPPVVVDVVCYPNACAPGAKLGVNQQQEYVAQVTGIDNQNADWYVCTYNSNPSSCTLGGNSTYGTISPATGTDNVFYTAPANVPTPSTIIIKAIPEGAAYTFGTTTLTISLQAISVQVQPPGPFTVPINESAPPFMATVLGSQDQTVSWYVNGILNGNSTVGTMQPDSQNIGEEDYIAPAQIPNPPTVNVTAVPEADPNVVSNAVPITIVLQGPTLEVSPNPAYPVLPGYNETFSANEQGEPTQTVNWALSLPSNEGTSCFNPATPCGTIVPQQTTTNGQPVVYTAPATTGNGGPLPDPWYVNLTATSNDNSGLYVTVSIKITQNVIGSFNIYPPQPGGQAGSTDIITFGLDNVINLPPDSEVSWAMSCNSLAPNGENCGPGFGQYKDGGGPGCITYQGQPLKQCSTGGFNLDGTNLTFNYTLPKVLGPDYDQIPQCNTQPGQSDGFVAITAAITPSDPNICPPEGVCEQTVCIDISPPAPK
jgi:hypothetical protein